MATFCPEGLCIAELKGRRSFSHRSHTVHIASQCRKRVCFLPVRNERSLPDNAVGALADDILDVILLADIEGDLAGTRRVGRLRARHDDCCVNECLCRENIRGQNTWVAGRGVNRSTAVFLAQELGNVDFGDGARRTMMQLAKSGSEAETSQVRTAVSVEVVGVCTVNCGGRPWQGASRTDGR